MMNPDIIQVDLYNTQKEVVANKSRVGTWKDPGDESLLKVARTFATGNNSVIIDPKTGNRIRYTYLTIPDYGAPSEKEMYFVCRTVYSIDSVNTLIFSTFVNLIALLFIGGIIAICTAFITSRIFSAPINNLVEDIDIIASGDLDHQVRSSGSTELRHIETAITGLVTNLQRYISDLKKREEDIRSELEKRCRAEENDKRLIESAHDAIFILENGKIMSCNNAAAILTGRAVSEIVGRGLDELSPQYQSDGNESTVKICNFISRISVEEKCSCEWNFKKTDGKLVETEANMSAILSDGNILIMGIFRDVTAIHGMQKREAYAVAQIEENIVKFAEINDEIRNPLTVISMLNDLGEGKNQEKILTQIRLIDSLINEADKQYIKSDKVRIFLKKHYGIGQEKSDDANNEEF
jgi:PAS domain S-box-containing protein